MEAAIYNHRVWIKNTDPPKLVQLLTDLLDASGFAILNFMEHHFSPQGYTAIWLLAESHLAVHTFPEASKTYIELSSCDKQKFDNFLNLAAHQASFSLIEHAA
jgi:S-adenosylmethionine decarboxylase